MLTQSAARAVDRDKYLIDGRVAMDGFIRYESLVADLKNVCDRVGFPFRPGHLGQYKSGLRASHRPSEEYYEPPAALAVRDVVWLGTRLFRLHRPMIKRLTGELCSHT